MQNNENNFLLSEEEYQKAKDKISHLLSLPYIPYEEFKALSDLEKREVQFQLQSKQAQAPAEEYATLENKLAGILDADQRTDRWQYIHVNIMNAIRRLMKDNGAMPNHTEIAVAVGLHRNTVRAHLRQYEKSPLYQSQLQQYRFAATAIVDQLMMKAMDGDNRSAKVFIECLPKIESWQIPLNMDGTRVLVKGVELTQEALDNMPEANLVALQQAVVTALQPVT